MKQHWSGYLNALGATPKPVSTNTIAFPTTSDKLGVSGFLDLTPKNPEIQARYDAMSLKWEGVSASDKAMFSKGLFKADALPFSK